MRRAVALLIWAVLSTSADAEDVVPPQPPSGPCLTSSIAEPPPFPGPESLDCGTPPIPIAPDDHRCEVHVDYLYWYLQRLRVPPMLAAGPPNSSGRLDDPGVNILRGDRLTSRHTRYIGVRPEIDWWADDGHCVGFQATAFFLERDSTYFTVPWNTFPTLSIPYIDARDGSSQARIIAGHDPNLGDLAGSSVVYSRIELFGQEANALFRWIRGDDFDVYWLAGGRFLQLRERLDLISSSRILPTESTVLGLEDRFSTFNKFYGGQLGLSGEYRCGPFFVDGKASAALGVNDQLLRMKGESIYHIPGDRRTQPYGLFVLPSNRGEYQRCVLNVVTELKINVGVELTSWLRIHAGYSLITWHNPIRPGDQIEPVNLSQVQPGGLTGPLQPTVPWREDLFWAHGGNIGIEVRW